jgi:lysophospholipase L1-like esterase
MHAIRHPAAVLLALAALAGCVAAPKPAAISAGAKYVAMGSSYAAGPGIPSYYEADPKPCYRSDGNYAHLLARRMELSLTDVSCSGATTLHLTGPRDNIPPQLDAVDAETRLVTITIGGNDLGYMTQLFAMSCFGLARETGAKADCNPVPSPLTEQDYTDVSARMDAIAREVRRRAPQARLVFVDYLTVLPPQGGCAAAPLTASESDSVREVARRLAAITAKAATGNGGDVLRASDLSASHSACADDAWMNGYPRPNQPIAGTGYHPNAKGMIAIADALEAMLTR